MKHIFTQIAVVFFAVSNSNAASFDCAKAVTVQEKTVCGNPTLSSLDERLSEYYKKARSISQDVEKLKTEQIDWIKEVRKCQSDATCIERLYTARIEELNRQTSTLPPEPVSGPPSTIVSAIGPQVSLPQAAASATDATPAVPAASPVASATTPSASQAKNVGNEPKQDILFDPDYKRIAFIIFGVLVAIIIAFFALKFLVKFTKTAATRASVATREGVSKITNESEKIRDSLGQKSREITETATVKAKAISEQANVAASRILTEFNKEGGHKEVAQAKIKEVSANLTPKIKFAAEAYVILFKRSPWIVGIITLLLIGYLFGGGGSVSKDYKQDFEYVYYSDGSCRTRGSEVCIDIKQAQYLCEKASGVTKYLYDNLKYGNLGDKARTLFAEGSVGSFNYKWNGRQCVADISAEGLYKGSSAKARLSGYITTYIISKDQEALVHRAFLSED